MGDVAGWVAQAAARNPAIALAALALAAAALAVLVLNILFPRG